MTTTPSTGPVASAHVRPTDLSETTRRALLQAGLDPDAVVGLIRAALAEDLGERGDLTSQAIVPASARLNVSFTARAAGVVCGLPVLAAIVDHVIGHDAALDLLCADGDRVGPGQPLATLVAPARQVLAWSGPR